MIAYLYGLLSLPVAGIAWLLVAMAQLVWNAHRCQDGRRWSWYLRPLAALVSMGGMGFLGWASTLPAM